MLFSSGVPLEFTVMASMASGFMNVGMSYLALAEGEGTPIGDDCWEWSETYGTDTMTLRACTVPGGGAEWSVDVDGCTALTGEVDAGGLSGGWVFYDECPGNDKVMTLDWLVDATDSWDMVIAFWDGSTEMMSIAFDQNADGSGECAVSAEGVLEWTMDWQIVGEQVTGNFCTYVDGVLDGCEPFSSIFPAKP